MMTRTNNDAVVGLLQGFGHAVLPPALSCKCRPFIVSSSLCGERRMCNRAFRQSKHVGSVASMTQMRAALATLARARVLLSHSQEALPTKGGGAPTGAPSTCRIGG